MGRGTVSYTHLDVYKRQAPDLYISEQALEKLSGETKIFRIAFDTIDSSYDKGIMAVSYTHLDVYKRQDFEGVEMLYEDVPDTPSQLIRTAFVPQDNRKLIVADFSAIEEMCIRDR